MSTFKHPAFPEIVTTVPDDRDDDHIAAGWLPLRLGKRAKPADDGE